jgi:hypothetical protein
MSRYRCLFDRHGKLAEFQDGELVWARPGAFDDQQADGPQIVRDIEPYRSMIDGTMIDGRKRHRDHLKAHGCLEVGNDTSHLKPRAALPPQRSVKESLHRVLADVGDRELKQMIQREIKDRR